MPGYGTRSALGSLDDVVTKAEDLLTADNARSALDKAVAAGLLLSAGYHIPFEGLAAPISGAASGIGAWHLGKGLGPLRRVGLTAIGAGGGAALGAKLFGRKND
jgi:hypothetical protein